MHRTAVLFERIHHGCGQCADAVADVAGPPKIIVHCRKREGGLSGVDIRLNGDLAERIQEGNQRLAVMKLVTRQYLVQAPPHVG